MKFICTDCGAETNIDNAQHYAEALRMARALEEHLLKYPYERFGYEHWAFRVSFEPTKPALVLGDSAVQPESDTPVPQPPTQPASVADGGKEAK